MLIYEDFIVVVENSKCTRKIYKAVCDNCNKDLGYVRKISHVTGLCRNCFGKVRLVGRQFTQDSADKMSAAAKKRIRPKGIFKHTAETKQLLSQKQEEHCRLHGNQFTTGSSGGKHTTESIVKMSVSNLRNEPRWKGRIFEYRGPKGTFKLRSSYELAYANWMDSQGIDWEYEPKFILSNGLGFCPDFRLKDGTIVEVKGFWTEKAKAKWDLFKTDNPLLHTQVIMKNDLIKLGLEV